MLELIKTALRISTDAFDDELELLAADCLNELQTLGVTGAAAEPNDPQILTTVISYCKWKFGNNPDADRWEHIYHDKLAYLQSASGYGLRGAV